MSIRGLRQDPLKSIDFNSFYIRIYLGNFKGEALAPLKDNAKALIDFKGIRVVPAAVNRQKTTLSCVLKNE